MSHFDMDAIAISRTNRVAICKTSDLFYFLLKFYTNNYLATPRSNRDLIGRTHPSPALIDTIPGLHFQSPPFAEDNPIRLNRKQIFDRPVDIPCSLISPALRRPSRKMSPLSLPRKIGDNCQSRSALRTALARPSRIWKRATKSPPQVDFRSAACKTSRVAQEQQPLDTSPASFRITSAHLLPRNRKAHCPWMII
jgi:hypothetical protein